MTPMRSEPEMTKGANVPDLDVDAVRREAVRLWRIDDDPIVWTEAPAPR